MRRIPSRHHYKKVFVCLAVTLLTVATMTLERKVGAGGQDAISFNRDIRPIFSDTCFRCHGPDQNARKVGLRLDIREEATKKTKSGVIPIVPGKPEESEIVRRIFASEKYEVMPPPEAHKELTARQKETVKRWIAEGARYEGHWAYQPIRRPAAPGMANSSVDAFIRARLAREGLQPAPEADRQTLIRRVTFDLTGLPPTPQEVDAFLNDTSPAAYEKVVDRLLGSPRYGERMAFEWLDAARYADTNGYQIDGERSMWRWRDWVIEAFNRNLPFDRFVIEQLAGDLLPNPTLDQKIATAFNRNHRINAEGGIVPEEYRIEYVVDRVDTTSTVLIGLTMGCARCHDHKYDPYTQKEYYQLTAYFNSIDEDGHSFDQGNSPPVIAAPTREQQRQLWQLDQEVARAKARYNNLARKAAGWRREWEKSLPASTGKNQQWLPDENLIVYLPLDQQQAPVFNKSDRAHHNQDDLKDDLKEKERAGKPAGFKDGAPRYIESPAGQGTAFDGKLYFDGGLNANFRYKSTTGDYRERFTIAAWVYPESEQSGAIVTKVSDSPAEVENNIPRAEGYGLYFLNGKVHFNMVFRWGEDTLRVETADTLPLKQWRHVAVVFDGLKQWEDRIRIYINGRQAKLRFNQRNFFLFSGGARETLKIGAGGGPQFRFKGAIDEAQMYSRALEAEEIAALACPDSLDKIAAIAATKRTRAQAWKLDRAFLAQAAPEELKQAHGKLAELKQRKRKFEDDLPSLMVMEETPEPKPAFVLKRGAYDAPGEKVKRGVPAALPPLPKEFPNNRLGLAKWLVGPDHPLTARVRVNRLWQMLFGAGLVKTAEDFGSQGELPSHPELLDWLAAEFRDRGTEGQRDRGTEGQRDKERGNNPQSSTSNGRNPQSAIRNQGGGWNVKALIKTIVMSATYRQSSNLTPELLRKDPENRLLARGPRLRLSAEMIRDQALSVSGLLVEKLGGPSVKPYQPDGVYKDMAFSGLAGYDRDKGEGLWRRSLYTYWKRTVLAPNMQVFDASSREFCRVREVRTNTPLQALNLMNDVTYVEAARLLGQRMLIEGGQTPMERLAWAYRLATSRKPSESEMQVLLRNLKAQTDYFTNNPAEATRLLAVGARRGESLLDPAKLAAYAMTAGLILNLDEVITKQ